MSTDKTAIEAAVQTYFDGLYEADADKLGSVFHPTSELTVEKDGKIVVWTRDQWLDNVRKRESAKSKGSARDDAILNFDPTGPPTATAREAAAATAPRNMPKVSLMSTTRIAMDMDTRAA